MVGFVRALALLDADAWPEAVEAFAVHHGFDATVILQAASDYYGKAG